jgi:ribose 5-phosphate isomerase A
LTYDDAIKALSNDALKLVKNHQTIGLGSGRAATAFVKSLSLFVKKNKFSIKCIPTSLQIKLEAEKGKLHLIDTVLDKIDIVFDGADQIDKEKNLIKGGGGALTREKVVAKASKEFVVIADCSKFVKTLNFPVPIEVLPFAYGFVRRRIEDFNGICRLRPASKKLGPVISDNGNFIADCDFGEIADPRELEIKLNDVPGVIENGIFSDVVDRVVLGFKEGVKILERF